MRLYKITTDTKTVFVGTKADGVTERKKLADEGFARKEITETEIDVPTDKIGLIVWLNANAT